MKTKEQVIKESWGSHYDIVKNKLDEFGWCQDDGHKLFDNHKIYDNDENFDFSFWGVWDSCEVKKYRPRSLRGIEDNNEWIKIKSEDDLPKEDCLCFIYDSFYKEIRTDDFYTSNGYFLKSKHIRHTRITHYQQILKPKPPIY